MRLRLLIFAVSSLGGGQLTPALGQTTINLGSAADYTVLGGASVANTGLTIVQGNLGVSPGTSISGFSGYAPGGPGLVVGAIHAGDSSAMQAASDLSAAYGNAAGQMPTVTGLATLANTTLGPGVYNAPSSLGISGIVTLDGHGLANPTFIFQIGTTLGTAAGSQILLINGAVADDIFWQVGSAATLGAASTFDGNLLADTTIDVGAGATIEGRTLAMGAITLNSDTLSAVPEPAETSLLMAGCASLFAAWTLKRRPHYTG